MVRTKFGQAPTCINGKRHQWKKGNEKYGECAICARCGYDVLDKCYKQSSD